ncbi:MAG: TPM domain-containing protein [Rhodobacteraceae bacterium]|nr:TPM domain-containing protein [Paracoccaceae bacterium]
MRLIAITLFLVTFVFQPVAAQNYPNYTSVFVNDFADLLDPETEARVEAALQQVKQDRDVEMTVVTIQSRNDYGNAASIEEFATGLFNYWGVGDANRNDGIMVLVARTDRDMRIELGAGYPAIFDDRVKRVIDHYFIPFFRRDEYAAGIEAGVLETIKRTKLVFSDTGKPTFASRLRLEGGNVVDTATSGGWLSWILGLLGVGGGGFGIRRYLRRRPRKCNLCNRKMRHLNETKDDFYLSQGQQVEEALKSKDYDVWYCIEDDHAEIIGYRNWFSFYSACKNCNFRTLDSKRTVITSATTSSEGIARVDYSCQNCKHEYSEKVIIPKKSKSSSSSSGGSSFGGGSSSGGGASGSW